MSVQIDKITLKIGDREIGLSPEEAKELVKILGELLGEKPPEIVNVPAPYPVYPTVPWWPGEYPWPGFERWKIVWTTQPNTSGGSANYYSNITLTKSEI